MSTLSEILEALRHRAEEYTADAAITRRPSWAPALVINDEFVQLARAVGLLKEDDKPIIRLWAKFADPRRKGTLLREHVGLTLAGVRCRGFDVHAGMKRKGPCIFWAKRGDDGNWEQGPSAWTVPVWPAYELQRKLSEQRSSCARFARTMNQCGGPEHQPNMVRDLEQMQQVCAELEQEYRTVQTNIDKQNTAWGDHLTQMVAGARVTGHCCICGKELTDPVSIERGIGPDCYSKHSSAINAWVARQQSKVAPFATETDLFAEDLR